MGFRRLLSSVGVGAATVDTRLEGGEFTPGDEVRGVVEIRGGDVEQEIRGIRLEVQTYYKREVGDNTVTDTGIIGSFDVSGPRVVQPNTDEQVPFSLSLPYETPLTLGRSSVWVRTALDIERAIDPLDSDGITVLPNPSMHFILDSFGKLGFRMREADNEELPHRLRRHLSFAQEIEFVATGGEFRGRFDEVELVMFPSEDAVELLLQVDRRARGLGSFLSEGLGTDESYASLRVPESATPSEIREAIAATLRRHA